MTGEQWLRRVRFRCQKNAKINCPSSPQRGQRFFQIQRIDVLIFVTRRDVRGAGTGLQLDCDLPGFGRMYPPEFGGAFIDDSGGNDDRSIAFPKTYNVCELLPSVALLQVESCHAGDSALNSSYGLEQ